MIHFILLTFVRQQKYQYNNSDKMFLMDQHQDDLQNLNPIDTLSHTVIFEKDVQYNHLLDVQHCLLIKP